VQRISASYPWSYSVNMCLAKGYVKDVNTWFCFLALVWLQFVCRHVFLGFSRDGQFVFSYTLHVGDNDAAIPSSCNCYRLQCWLFIPYQPLHLVLLCLLMSAFTLFLLNALQANQLETTVRAYVADAGKGHRHIAVPVSLWVLSASKEEKKRKHNVFICSRECASSLRECY